MTAMVFTDEGTFSTFGEAPIGSLVRWFGYREGAEPLLVYGNGGERRVLALSEGADWRMFQGDHRDRVLILGTPAVRYDPTSRRKQGYAAEAGDLVWSGARFGIRAGGGHYSGVSSWETPVGWLDGTWSIYHHTVENEAFTCWQLGFMRGDRFVIVVDHPRPPLAPVD